uniref:Uncharacterized protein n=1 Tax=Anopheles atroparvus TaxID=41427 RepID=A0A182JFU1_ANOAO
MYPIRKHCCPAKSDEMVITCTPKQPDASAQKQYTHAQHILNALTQIKTEKIRLHPELSLLIKRGLNPMGRDLPYGYDYFISAQISRTQRNDSEVKSCQFWGVVRALGCDYYILELEHREKSVDYCAQRDPCAGETHHTTKESTATLHRGRLERLQVEVRLNSRSYLVSENPCTKPWQRLPPVTMEQLKAVEGLRVFLAGNLKAKVRQVGQPFDGLEENLLRALIAKISAYRDGHIDASETNISLVKCLSGMYGSVTGFNHELLLERSEHWCERNEHGLQYWSSETWPGLSAFIDGEQFRCCYFGWGLERLTHWYSPIVRIPEMQEEYVAELNQNGDYKQDTELQTELTQSIDIVHELKE